jgi:parvulin-like peptidyl-prolyl isomerase
MKVSLATAFVLGVGLAAQQPPTPSVTMEEALAPGAVVATVGGKPVTYGELEVLLKAMPQQMANQALADRKSFVQQYALLRHLVQMAEQQKLDQQSPYKEGIAYNRMQLLYQAVVGEKFNQIKIPPEEVEKLYQSNQERYTQARVKVLYISFTNAPPPQGDPAAKKPLNEAEAKAKAEDLLKQIRGGADFVKLVKAHSEDETSAAKDGDFGTIRRSDKIPDEIKQVIFALKAGEVGGPVRQPNGFYLFRVEEVSTQKLDEVRETIQNELRNIRFAEWMEQLKTSLQVKEEIPEFFSPKRYDLPVPKPPKP